MQLHLGDLDAGAVAVEDLLHQLLHLGLGLGAGFGQDRLDVALADDLAHGALGHRLHRAFGILDVEQKVGRVGDPPEHDEVDIDDVLVAGDHQAFLGHVADRRSWRRGLSEEPRMPTSMRLMRVTFGSSTCSIG